MIRLLILTLLAAGCAAPLADDPPAPELAPPAAGVAAPTIIVPPSSPAERAWARRMWLLRELPALPADQVQLAAALTNRELSAAGYELRVAAGMPVHLGTPGEIAELAGEPAHAWSLSSAVYMVDGGDDLCASPADYEGKRYGWVLSHELLHTVGFEHGAPMNALTDAVGQLWDAWCQANSSPSN